MTPRNRVTIFCAGLDDTDDERKGPHPEHKLGVCYISDTGDVIGTADFATPILDGTPVSAERRRDVRGWHEGDHHYRLRIECPACHLSVEYHGPDEWRTTIRARAFVGAPRLALAQLIGYASE